MCVLQPTNKTMFCLPLLSVLYCFPVKAYFSSFIRMSCPSTTTIAVIFSCRTYNIFCFLYDASPRTISLIWQEFLTIMLLQLVHSHFSFFSMRCVRGCSLTDGQTLLTALPQKNKPKNRKKLAGMTRTSLVIADNHLCGRYTYILCMYTSSI